MSDGDREQGSLERRWAKGGKSLDDLGLAMEGHRRYSVDVTGFSVKAPVGSGGDFLITVRGFDEEGAPVVGFHGSVDLLDAICGAQNRVQNGTMKWKPDEWAKGR